MRLNTFLPYRDFAASARCLDRARLGKQRIECLQILNVILEINAGAKWGNHPAVCMWRGFAPCLLDYSLQICREWVIARGYKDTVTSSLHKLPIYVMHPESDFRNGWVPVFPPWLDDEELHASHRSNLLRKDEEYYRKFGWTEPTDLPYKWPIGRAK